MNEWDRLRQLGPECYLNCLYGYDVRGPMVGPLVSDEVLAMRVRKLRAMSIDHLSYFSAIVVL